MNSVVVVVDMDGTLGYHDSSEFIVRPYVNLFVRALDFADIILWSAGDDEYVRTQVNCYLPIIVSRAHKIFARTQCNYSHRYFNGVQKCSTMIRNIYARDIYLIGVDDNASRVMDDKYDLRIEVPEYKCCNNNDTCLVKALDTILERVRE